MRLLENLLLNQLKEYLKKNDKNKIIFTSLQVLRNTYNYSLEKSNIMSKNTYNLFFLWIFLTVNTQTTLFNCFFKWKLSFKKIKFKRFKLKNITFYVNHLYFFNQNWFLTLFNIMILKLKKLPRIKKQNNKKIIQSVFKKLLFL